MKGSADIQSAFPLFSVLYYQGNTVLPYYLCNTAIVPNVSFVSASVPARNANPYRLAAVDELDAIGDEALPQGFHPIRQDVSASFKLGNRPASHP